MIKFFFTYEGQKVALPVNPPSLTITKAGNNQDMEIVKLGQINILRDAKLAEFSIESFFPASPGSPYVTAQSEWQPPSFYISFFEKIMGAKKPMEFGVSELEWPSQTKKYVSVEGFVYQRESGSDDVLYTLMLKEYIPYQATATSSGAQANASERLVTKATQKTYTVKSGDTLWAISKQFLGDGARYMEIATLNNIKNPNLIYPGQVFQIPN